MQGPQRAKLRDGRRWHFQHGPIDLILEGFGEAKDVEGAYAQAWQCFETILPNLIGELPTLRRHVEEQRPQVRGPAAKRMIAAVWPHRNVFVTPMAAVAGAVADEVLEALVANHNLERAYVNNGGDIALFLSPGQRFKTGLVTQPVPSPHPLPEEEGIKERRHDQITSPAVWPLCSMAQPVLTAILPGGEEINGAITITSDMPIRGIATSGRGGRSLSLGIADSVTVLAENAAAADVAATLIANAINVEHPAIDRVPAVELDPDSDLGDRLVTVSVGALGDGEIEEALNRGAERAEAMRLSGMIEAARLSLAGRHREVLPSPVPLVRI